MNPSGFSPLKHPKRPKAPGEREGRVIESGRFEHVMALTLNPLDGHRSGIVRCITDRSGDLHFKGNIDRSQLYLVHGDSLQQFEIGERLTFENEEEIMSGLMQEGDDFIGFEDPDLIIDDETGLMHVYFTIPIEPDAKKGEHMRIHLGHAVGNDLASLRMTMPVLLSDARATAKEVSIAPKNAHGIRLNLVESRDRRPEGTYSTVQVARAASFDGPWEYGPVAFHPCEQDIHWIAGHASPGPLLSREFLDMGEGKRVGFINGREADRRESGKTKYGMFSVGLFIYDYEKGKIEWVSSEPFIQDSEAQMITFASKFVETAPGEGVLYAHVDDSFVRAYDLASEAIRTRLPGYNELV